MFIPDPEALKDGTQFLRELRFRIAHDDGRLVLPVVRIESRGTTGTFTKRKKKRRVYIPIDRPSRWAYRQTMKRRFSRKIRDIVVMVAGVRRHMNLSLWRDSENMFTWHGVCQDCGATLWVGPGFWLARPGTLRFRGMAFVDDCPKTQPVRAMPKRPEIQPFSRLLAGKRRS